MPITIFTNYYNYHNDILDNKFAFLNFCFFFCRYACVCKHLDEYLIKAREVNWSVINVKSRFSLFDLKYCWQWFWVSLYRVFFIATLMKFQFLLISCCSVFLQIFATLAYTCTLNTFTNFEFAIFYFEFDIFKYNDMFRKIWWLSNSSNLP